MSGERAMRRRVFIQTIPQSRLKELFYNHTSTAPLPDVTFPTAFRIKIPRPPCMNIRSGVPGSGTSLRDKPLPAYFTVIRTPFVVKCMCTTRGFPSASPVESFSGTEAGKHWHTARRARGGKNIHRCFAPGPSP